MPETFWLSLLVIQLLMTDNASVLVRLREKKKRGEIDPKEEGPSDAVEIEPSGAGLFGALPLAEAG